MPVCDGELIENFPLDQLQSVEVIKKRSGYIQFVRFIDINGVTKATHPSPPSLLPEGWISATIVCSAKGYTCIGLKVISDVSATEKSLKSLKMYAIPIGACSCDDPTINSLSIKVNVRGTAVALDHVRSCDLSDASACTDESKDLVVVS